MSDGFEQEMEQAFPSIHLEETGGVPEGGGVGVSVPVNVIMDQMHQHYARIIADQVQRNAELAAALTVVTDELTETKSKLQALTDVTNAPESGDSGAVRTL